MEQPHDSPDQSTFEAVRRSIMGFRTTQMLHVAAKLGLADLLKSGPRHASDIAAAVGAHPRSLYRLLRALASLGFFAETADGRFELTAQAQTLRSDIPGSLRDTAVLYGDTWVWSAYAEMAHSVMTGTPAFDQVYGQTMFEYLRSHPEAAATFDRGMTAYSKQEAAAILAAYDFSNASNLVDVGGGHGALLAAILQAYPDIRGILFEQSSVIDGARIAMTAAGLANRCSFEPGDFFHAVPAGGDVYMLKSILHNWDDDRSTTILDCCRNVMRPGHKLLIFERVIPVANEPSEAKLFDINMLVVLGAAERTEAQYATLLQKSRFALRQTIPTEAPVSIVEAVPR